MGVYSELAAQRVNEASMLENFQFSDLLEYAINIDRANQSMFDAMLEMDFHEAYVEKGLISINEADEKGAFKAAIGKIAARIRELWEKFISVATTFTAKLSNVFAQYSGRNKSLLKSNLGDKAVELIDIVPEDLEVKYFVGEKDFYKTFNVDITEINNILNSAKVNPEEDKAKVDEVFKNVGDNINDYFENIKLKEGLESSKINLSHIEEGLKDPKKEGKDFIETVNKLIGLAKDQIKNAKKLEDRAEANDKFAVYSYVIKCAFKYMNFYKSAIARKLMYERSVYAKCAAIYNKHNKSAKQESTNIDFTLGSIDIVNETFIEELFV